MIVTANMRDHEIEHRESKVYTGGYLVNISKETDDFMTYLERGCSGLGHTRLMFHHMLNEVFPRYLRISELPPHS